MIETRRTARYFISGDIDENTRNLFFAFHGYAQNADQFLQSLTTLHQANNALIAPEGLSKMYWKDLFTEPTSSWMTKLEREYEIQDFLFYMQKIYDEIRSRFALQMPTTHLFGFSQGAAMASRMAMLPQIHVDNLILWGGLPAHDLDWTMINPDMTIHIIFGKDDPFLKHYPKETIQQLKDRIPNSLVIKEIEGKHSINEEGLSYIHSFT